MIYEAISLRVDFAEEKVFRYIFDYPARNKGQLLYCGGFVEQTYNDAHLFESVLCFGLWTEREIERL